MTCPGRIRSSALLADLRREPSVDRLDLVGLDDVEILDLMGAAAGHEMADDGVALAHALRRETAGNPFFLVEVLRHLAETGAFAQDADGRWVLSDDLDDLGLPSSIREVVAQRVARLGEPTEKALALAAVIGRDFDVDVLTTLVDTDEDTLLDLLDGAIAAGIVGEPEQQFGRYRFVHALIQHTLYQDLGTARRQRAHQRIAEALEARADDDRLVAELAHHWMAATRPADAAKAIHYARRAGDAALAATRPSTRWTGTRRPSSCRPARPPVTTTPAASSSSHSAPPRRQAGLPEHRDTLREAGRIALRLGDRDLLVSVALARTPGVESMAEVDPDRLAVLDAALAAVGPADSIERARLLACLAEEIDPRDAARRCEVATEAIDVAHRIDDDATTLAVLTLALNPFSTPDILDRRLHESELALELADRFGDVSARFQARAYRMVAAGEVGDIDEFDAASRRDGSDRAIRPTSRSTTTRSTCSDPGDTSSPAARPRPRPTPLAALDIGTKIGLSFAAGTYGSQLLAARDPAGAAGGLRRSPHGRGGGEPDHPRLADGGDVRLQRARPLRRGGRAVRHRRARPSSATSPSTRRGCRRRRNTRSARPTSAGPMPRRCSTTSCSPTPRDSSSSSRSIGAPRPDPSVASPPSSAATTTPRPTCATP